MSRTIFDVGEEQIDFINEFLVDVCLEIDPEMTKKKLNGNLKAVVLEDEVYSYFLYEKIPLLTVDLKLLIDGV